MDAPGTTLTDETVDVTLVVALTGNDTTGTGTAASPCRTIAKGRAEARALGVPPISVGSSQIPNPDAKRVKVLVRAGTYREGDIQSDIFQDSVKTLILAGEVDSSGRPATIMSGFEVWDDDAWTANFGTQAWPSTFQALPSGNQLAERREIILVGGRLLEQRMNVAGLGPECFAVDETANTITVRTTTNPNTAVAAATAPAATT